MPFIVSTQKGGSSNSQSYTTITDGSDNAVLDNGNSDDNSPSNVGLLVQNQNRLWNNQEDGWDRTPANYTEVVLPSATRTATTSTSDILSPGHKGLGIYMDITSNSGSITLTPELYAKTITGTNYGKIWNAGDFTSSKFFFIYPGISETESGNTEQQNSMFGMPYTTKLTFVHSASNAITYSVDIWRLI